MRIRRRGVGGAAVGAAWLLLAFSSLAAACGNDTSPDFPSPPANPSPAATATPTDRGAIPLVAEDGPPSVDRILRHIEFLAGEIGPRVAGTESERRAADYIADILDAAGYDTSIEPFTFIDHYDDSRITLADGESVPAFMLDGSATGRATGRAVFGAMGHAEDLDGVPVRGNVLVLDRGEIPFELKVRNAEEMGAVAVIIVNHEARRYFGMLGDYRSSIPVVGTSLTQRDRLHATVEANLELSVEAESGQKERESQNVVGRNGETCEAYLGAHYDSVPGSPGANDNASGTALMLELARAYRVEGLCAIAFGAEEVGLWGSRAYVEQHLESPTRFMLNFDMVGKVTNPSIVGDDALTAEIVDIIRAVEGSPLRAGSFPPFASSDHRSFLMAGVPAVTIHSGDDEHLHTPEDDLDNVDAASLRTMLESAEAALQGLLRSYGIRD